MSLPAPRFPDGFRGRAVERDRTPFEEACRLSRCQKAEPGDLFYSRRHGMASCALVIEADRAAAEAAQALLVGQLAVAETLAELAGSLQPSLLWPFTICLGEREVARVAVGGLSEIVDADDTPDWLVLGMHLRLSGKFVQRLAEPDRRELTALEAEGVTTDRTQLLQGLARQLDRLQFEWQDEGLATIGPQWERYAKTMSSRPATRLDSRGNAMILGGETTDHVELLDMVARQLPLHLAA